MAQGDKLGQHLQSKKQHLRCPSIHRAIGAVKFMHLQSWRMRLIDTPGEQVQAVPLTMLRQNFQRERGTRFLKDMLALNER